MVDQDKVKVQILSAEVDEEGFISIDSDIINDVMLLNAMYNPISGKLTVLYAVMVSEEDEIEQCDDSPTGGEISNGITKEQETVKEPEG